MAGTVEYSLTGAIHKISTNRLRLVLKIESAITKLFSLYKW